MSNRVVYGGLACGIAMLTLFGVAAKTLHLRKFLSVAMAANSQSEVTQERPRPIRRFHDPVRPRRLDAWQIIGPGGGGTFYNATVSPHDPNLVVASTDMTGCYITENGGKTWRMFNLRMSCRAFSFDPKLPNRIYAMAAGAGLWRSEDRGHTWNLVYPNPKDVSGYWYLDDEGELYLQVGAGSYPQPMTAFATDPDNSDVLYAVIPDELVTSTDGGAHWKTLAKGVNAVRIFVDPTSPADKRKLYTVTGAATGIWDGTKFSGNLTIEGSTWFYGAAFGTPKGGTPVIYTANDYYLKDGVLRGGGILATTDGGLQWSSLNDGLLGMVTKGTYPEFSALGTSLFNPNVIYAALYAWHVPSDADNTYYGVMKSTDGGKSWEDIRRESGVTAENMHDSWLSERFGPDFGDQPLSFGVAADNPDLVYTTDLGRIMRSTDGGKNWDAVYSQGTPNGYTTTGLDVTTCYGVHFDPFDAKRMFISYTDIGLFRSEDGGESWVSSTTQGVPRAWVNTTYWVEFDPAVKGRMWSVMSRTHDLPRLRMFRTPGSTAGILGGVLISEDGGISWKVQDKGLPQMAATHIILDPKSTPNARVLYVTGFGRGVFKSVDGGQSWAPKNNGLPQTEPLTWRMALAGDGALYVVTIRRTEDFTAGGPGDGWLFRSRDGAETWERVALPEGLNGPVGITVDPQDPSRLYLSAWGRYKLYGFGLEPQQGGVFLSTDGGKKWSNVLDANRRIYDVTIDPRNPNIVYAAGVEASAWRSTDRGLTWKRIRGFNFKGGHRVIPSPLDPSKIYITTFGSSVWYGPAEGDPKAVEDIVSPQALKFDAPQSRSKQ